MKLGMKVGSTGERGLGCKDRGRNGERKAKLSKLPAGCEKRKGEATGALE